MRKICLQTITLAALAAASSIATPAVAGSPYYPSSDTGAMAGATAPHGAGHFTCSFNEQRTKLERKNCGHYRY